MKEKKENVGKTEQTPLKTALFLVFYAIFFIIIIFLLRTGYKETSAKDLALNIQANQQMLRLVDQLIKDNEVSDKIGLFQKIKNVYYLVKINNYYLATNEELLKTAFEHGFAMKRGEE